MTATMRVFFGVKAHAPGFVAVRGDHDGRGEQYFDMQTLAYSPDEARELVAQQSPEINKWDPVVRIAQVRIIECEGEGTT